MTDIADALICDTTPQVIQHAVNALENHTLRGLDAIHLSAALACTTEVFISADARQCRAAEAFGLQVVSL
ncbi:type II toxin-antitoxin system VapC family toxin [Acidithiobacillus ferrianus]|uniref:Type II toxin-antitoxin system VapC family toxin n=2 Tax=Acidithiobacillus ferrianus TaxID=2678518 RepID=A0ACD5H2X2_9PROT|nr:type II toxin-antitoxin system VapC family toxin [Acidithiobacillus ferrianus]